MEIKTEADSNDITDDKSTIGMLGFCDISNLHVSHITCPVQCIITILILIRDMCGFCWYISVLQILFCVPLSSVVAV